MLRFLTPDWEPLPKIYTLVYYDAGLRYIYTYRGLGYRGDTKRESIPIFDGLIGAQQMEDTQAITLLQQTLDEEYATDQKLTQLAVSRVNEEAQA